MPTLLGLRTNCRKVTAGGESTLSFRTVRSRVQIFVGYQHRDISWNSVTCPTIARGD